MEIIIARVFWVVSWLRVACKKKEEEEEEEEKKEK